MIAILFLAFIGFIITFVIASLECTTNYKDSSDVGSMIGCIILLIIFILAVMYQNDPSAIDVYRGKTTLEITYKDNIPIDSVVVFK